ncbi:hypothetical protein [uncultured Lamprocystis sp.]|nr:hypothetical protein [uncultured Lamprocystis sp.]
MTPEHDWNRLAWWQWAAPLGGAMLVGAKAGGLLASGSALFIAAAVALLGGAVFAAVHHAEVLAVRIGEPFGSILLALAITCRPSAIARISSSMRGRPCTARRRPTAAPSPAHSF